MAHKDNIKNDENAKKQAGSLEAGAVIEEVAEAPVPLIKSVNQSGNRTGAIQLRPPVAAI